MVRREVAPPGATSWFPRQVIRVLRVVLKPFPLMVERIPLGREDPRPREEDEGAPVSVASVPLGSVDIT